MQSVRDHVLFSQDSAQSELIRQSRYAVRGFSDGQTKYARYYGIGGGIDRTGTPADTGKRFDTDADFDDHDHEWYDLDEDPHELVNLAQDRSCRAELARPLRATARVRGGRVRLISRPHGPAVQRSCRGPSGSKPSTSVNPYSSARSRDATACPE